MNRKLLYVGGGLLLVLLLAAAAFVGGRLLGEKAPEDNLPQGASLTMSGGGQAGPVGESVSLEVKQSEELPQQPPDVLGAFSRREDNRIFVSSSGQGVMMVVEGGAVEGSAESGGPVTHSSGPVVEPGAEEKEIVVTAETKVYEDVTAQKLGGGPPSGGTVQQALEPGTVDGIAEGCVVLAWGEKRGDRLVAEILVYSSPMIITR